LTIPSVLQVGPLPPHALGALRRHFVVVEAASLPAASLAAIRGIATSGKSPIDSDLLDRLPNLRLVSCLGAGTDGLDLGELERRGIVIATTASVLADDVADIAIGLVIALARDFRGADRFVREGRWAGGKYPLGVGLSGARLGILGLGTIGTAVARRAAALRMAVGYHNRTRQPGTPSRYFDSLSALAEWSQFLVVCCPGGAATHHLVDRRVLEDLGPEAWLVNVARGSVVDEDALADALEVGRIAGAGLDVFEAEPTPSPRLLVRDDVILLPHIGSATQKTRGAMARAMVDALVHALAPG
jgi:lactate dehydrogenase-like 2-hydroxyacid dehydrogenase